MILNEDQIRRMIDISGLSMGSSGGSGGGGGSIPAGSFVTPDYYSHNFGLLYKQVTTDGTTGTVTTAFELAAPNMIPTEGTETDPTTGNVVVTSIIGPQVMNALVIGNIMMVYDETNNAIKVVNRDGTTAANFYATGGVSALGYSPGGGGGGGADLNALLDSINTSSIGSITPGASNVGKCLVWTADGWAWGTTGEGGGGTVTAITAGTGLSGGTITASGTIALSQDTLTAIASGVTAYGWGDHAQAGYLTSSALTGYATQQWVNQQGFLTSSAISDMATKTWVNNQGFLTEDQYKGTVTSVGLSMPTGFSVSNSPVTSSGTLSVGIATGYFIPTTTQRTTWNGKQDAISDLATIRSGAAAGATAVQPSAISDMATQTWVGQQGFITASALSSYLPLTGGTLTGALHMGSAAGASPYIYWGDSSYAYIGEDSDDHITLRGDKGVNILTGSNYELQWNGNTLATQNWVVAQGYVTSNQIHEVEWWGQSMNADGVVEGNMTGVGNISFLSSGKNIGGLLYFDTTNGRVGVSQSSPSHKLDVNGNIHTNSAYYLDGKLFANNNSGLHIGYSFADADLPTTIWGDGISFRSIDGTYGECTTIGTKYGIMGNDFIGVTNKFRFEYDSTNNTVWVLKADGTPVNFASMGGVSALGVGSSGTPSIDSLRVTRIYFDATKYLEVSGSTLRYYNGSSYITIA